MKKPLIEFTPYEESVRKVFDDEKEFNYYGGELNRLNTDSEYFTTVVFNDPTGNKTKYLSINLESIPEIRKFLNRIENEILDRVYSEESKRVNKDTK